jgi:hypothetical protein
MDDSIVIYTLFPATWVTFEVQSDSGDLKLDLSLAMWVPDPTESSADLWATSKVIEWVRTKEL